MKTVIYFIAAIILFASCKKEEISKGVIYVPIESIEAHFVNESGDSMRIEKIKSTMMKPINMSSDSYVNGIAYVPLYNGVPFDNKTDTIEILVRKLKHVNSKVKIVFSTVAGYAIDKTQYFKSEADYQYKLSTYYEYYVKESTQNPIRIKGVFQSTYPYFTEIK